MRLVVTLLVLVIFAVMACVTLVVSINASEASPARSRMAHDVEHNVSSSAESEAANEYRRALVADPRNVNALDSLGRLYEARAKTIDSPVDSARLFLQGAELYKQEAENQVNGQARETAGKGFAQAAIEAGGQSLQVDDIDLRRQVKEALEGARAYVQNDALLAGQIDDLILKIVG